MTSPYASVDPELLIVEEASGQRTSVVRCRIPTNHRALSSAVLGGGFTPARWWINVQVDRHYDRDDPLDHLRSVAETMGLAGPGVGMLTAARVDRCVVERDSGVTTVATVGLGLPVVAAAPDEVDVRGPATPGTINLLIHVPAALSDAALVNTVITATEAKTQALLDADIPGTGTSSDAICVVCPTLSGDHRVEEYGGPRSRWGSRLARSVHRAVAEGTADWLARHPPGDEHRRWS